MWNWKKTLIPLTLTAALVIPTIALAVTANPATGDAKPKLTLEQRLEKFREHQQAQQQRIETLVNKYAPETLPQWQAAFAERKQIKEEMITLVKEKGGDIKDDGQAKRAELKAKVQAGEITKEEAKAQMQAYRSGLREDLKEWKADKKEEIAPYVEVRKELKAELKAAIQSGDEAAVKDVLNKMLEQYEKVNEVLSKKLAELKNGSPTGV